MREQFTTEDKLRAVEDVIDEFRRGMTRRDARYNHRMSRVLKSLARDLKAGEPEIVDKAFDALQSQIESAKRAKALGRLSDGHYRAVAEALIHHWPAIRSRLAVQ
jgi:hypothetical protein